MRDYVQRMEEAPRGREPIFVKGGLKRLILPAILFAIAWAVMYFTKYQYY